MSDSTSVDAPEDATKAQKSEIKKFNEKAKERRKTELVPVYEPIMLNCDFLFLLADEKDISDKERSRIDEMIHGDEESLFLSAPIEQLYKLDAGEIDEDEVEITFEGDELTIPVQFVTDTTQIEVVIEGEETITIDDWELTSVKRPDEDDISTFTAIYESEMADDVDYEGEEKISISIIPRDSSSCQTLNASFTAIREKRVGVLDAWDWLDDASKWSDIVSFERIFE